MIQLTREEIEQRLEKKYLGAVVSIELPWPEQKTTYTVSTKVQRIAVEETPDGPVVVFLGTAGIQYKADVNYFIENAQIHGDTHTRGTGSGRLPEGD